MKNNYFTRTEMILGNDSMNQLARSHVAIVGVGGVGGAVIEMLARSGVGRLTIIDFDTIDETNINRQFIALTSTIGAKKVDVWKKRILDINPQCEVNAICEKVNETNLSIIIPECDVVVDAIDMVSSKIALINYCKIHKIPIISAMGAGNRIDKPEFEVTDIYKTAGDGLAKVMRKNLRELNIESHTVVCAKTPAISPKISSDGKIGSIAYYPIMAGCVLAQAVIAKLANNRLTNN